MVKVGDMVRVIDAWSEHDVYKNGDVLEVIGLSDYGSGGVWVRTKKYSGHGDCGCDRKIEEPYAYLGVTEFEVAKDKEYSKGFRIGDRVVFTDDFAKSFVTTDRAYVKQVFVVKDFYKGKVVIENQKEPIVLDKDYLVLDEKHLEVLSEARPYSDKDIAAAESYIGKIITELSPEYKVQFSEYREDIQACHIWRESSLDKMDYRQTCYGGIPRGREYNKAVSRMIAMYYVFGIELPEWVY